MANPYIESLNKYAYPPLTYNLTDPSNQIQLSAKLCEIALMEGWHDHNDILNTTLYKDRINNAVISYTPAGCAGKALYHSEENYLSYVLTETPIVSIDERRTPLVTWKRSPTDTLRKENDSEWSDLFNTRIKERYETARVVLTKNTDTHSRVQKCFNEKGIKEDIYILRDVAYGCWADDITKWGQGLEEKEAAASNQYIYNVQTSSGIYDPGPSLSYFSVAGERCGYRNIARKSRYGLFDCSFPNEIILNYPAYIPDQRITCAEQLIYTKYKCTLFGDNTTTAGVVGKKDAEKMIESAAVNLIVEVPVLDANGNIDTSLANYPDLYLVTKHNSQKASSLFDLPLISSCIKYSARKDMIDIASKEYSFDQYNVITHSSPLKIMTKKFGDSGIAIQTLRPKLHFYEFAPIANNENNVNLIKRESNGIHAFLTFDQVATAAAIEYGAPIVIYNTQDYAIIFFSKTLLDSVKSPAENLKLLLNSIKDPFPEMNTAAATATAAVAATATETSAAAADTAVNKAANKTTELKGVMIGRTPSQSDINYGVYLTFWYKLGPFVKIYNDTLKTNAALNAESGKIIAEYVKAKDIAVQGIDNIDDVTTLTTISNAYRDYNKMISSYKSVTAAFSQVTGNINKLISNQKTIKIGDVSKIIDNCDPFKGTAKVQRVRKLFTCLRGQSPAGIELGITVIIQIYENLSGSPSIQEGFKTQIISLFETIASACIEELKETLRLAFDFIPTNYKGIFVSQVARGYVGTMTGGKDNSFSPVNSLSPLDSQSTDESMISSNSLNNKSLTSDKSVTLNDSNNLEPTSASITPSSIQNTSNTENDSQMFDGVIDKLMEIITYLDKSIKEDQSKDTGLLKYMKPLLEATKGVIEIQGSKYTKTLNSPLSYEHLEADTFIHQPLFIFTILQTLLEYSSTDVNTKDTEPQALKGGAPKRKRDREPGLLEQIFGDQVTTRSITTRSMAEPYKKEGAIKKLLNNNYKFSTCESLNMPENCSDNVFLSNNDIAVYGYVVDKSSLINIIKEVAISSRSYETRAEDSYDMEDNFSYQDTDMIIDDVTTSSSITNSILVRNSRDNNNLFDQFVVFINDLTEYYAEKIENIKSENEIETENRIGTYKDQVYNDLIGNLDLLTKSLQERLESQSIDNVDINDLLTTIFPTTFISPPRGGTRHKKTKRKQQKPKTSKYKKTRRKRSKSKRRQTKKRTITPKVRKPRKTRP